MSTACQNLNFPALIVPLSGCSTVLAEKWLLVPSIRLWLKRSGLSVAGLTAAESVGLHPALSAAGKFWI
jgi:hypothetical protein